MSDFDLMEDTVQRVPEYPKLGSSLLLIQTQKYLPFSSTANLDVRSDHLQDLEDNDLSIQVKTGSDNPQAIVSSATITRKKKGGCTCKKTRCLKMYCQCFSSGKLCGEDCNCQGCSNCESQSAALQQAKELAELKTKEMRKGRSSRGCNCKKSQCQKKYCECYNAGLPCGQQCRCLSCSNTGERCSPCATFEKEMHSEELNKIAESFID